VTVSPYAPSQTVTVTVTSNGYWGNPFLPQYPGQPNYGSSEAWIEAMQPVAVAILSASIPGDRIRVVLSPAGMSGTLTVQLLGGTTHTVYQGGASGGMHDLSFNIPGLPTAEFTQLRATWVAGGQAPSVTYGYHIQELGNYRHTQYNTPAETRCTGSQSPVTVYNNSCVATPGATMKGDFISQVLHPDWGTGSGHSLSYGDILREAWCTLRAYPTARRDQTITGAMGPVNNSTVAVCPMHGELHAPGRQVYIDGRGVKTVTDDCAACCQGTATKIDHYTTDTACYVYSLPDAKTVNLY